MNQDCWALTEKEKQTLRLIVRGHDAKSTARSLGLSVHTINERLRDARRKMAVSSSREAARLLLDAEGGSGVMLTPQSVGDREIGADMFAPYADEDNASIGAPEQAERRPGFIIGVCIMTLSLGLVALVALTQPTSTPSPTPVAAQEAPNAQVVDAARAWLTLLDQGRWDDSYRATATSFRSLNTLEMWTAASEQARAPLGTVLSRSLLSQENLPAPPHGYEVVKFRTHFANKPDAVETVTLDREDGGWHVVGVTIG